MRSARRLFEFCESTSQILARSINLAVRAAGESFEFIG
jgi:hypothetical protein